MHYGRTVEGHPALEVQVEGAVVHVGRTHDRHGIVAYEHLGVDEARRILVDFHPGLQQHLVVGTGHRMHVYLVGIIRGDDPYIDAALRGDPQRRDHLVVEDQVRRGDPHVVLRAVDDLDIGVLRHVLVVERAIAEGLHEPIGLALERRQELEHVEVLAGREHPQLQEHLRQVPHRVAPEHHRGILPMPEPDFPVDVLVGQVQAAVEADIAVHHAYLAVVAVVELGIEVGLYRIEHSDLEPHGAKLAVEMRRNGLDGPEIVVHDPDVDALAQLLLQHREYGVPHLPFSNDKVFKEDELLRLAKLHQQSVEEILPQRKVLHLGIAPDLESADTRNIVALAGKQRVVVLQRLAHHQVGAGQNGNLVGVFLLDDADLPLGVPADLLVAEHYVEQAAVDRQEHDQQHPGDLVRGILITCDDEERHDAADDVEHQGPVPFAGGEHDDPD